MFMKKTKLLTSICAFLFVLSFAGCEESTLQDSPIEEETDLEEDTDDNEGLTNPDEKKEKFTVWCPEEISSLTKTQIERYTSQFEGTDNEFPYKLVIESVSESNAVSSVLTDVTTAGDIFFFSQEQLTRLALSGAISQVPERFVDDVTTRNDTSSVDAASFGGELYVYPTTSDNGYFAYYDTSVLNAEDMKNQETIITKCSEAGKKVSFELTSGWYNAAYFFGAGCVSEWGIDTYGNFVDYYDTYNSNPDGYDALEGMAQLIGLGVWIDNSAATNFDNKYSSNSAVVVSGTWDETTAKQCLGDNYAACELWSVTVPAETRATYLTEGIEDTAPEAEIDNDGNRTYHLGSFSGSKLLCVKRNSDGEKVTWAHNIANYLTSEECQLERFNSNGWGPSNLKAQEDEAVKEDIALGALQAQNKYSQTQGDYPNSWWDNATKIGTDVHSAGTTTLTKDQMDTILASYDSSNEAVLTASQFAYAVVGNLEGCSWQTHPVAHGSGYPQYAFSSDNAEYGTYSVDSDGTIHGKWTTTIDVVSEGVTLTDGSAVGLIRIVDYGSWSGNYGYTELVSGSLGECFGYDNNIALAPGTYNLVFDYTSSSPAITISAIQ